MIIEAESEANGLSEKGQEDKADGYCFKMTQFSKSHCGLSTHCYESLNQWFSTCN